MGWTLTFKINLNLDHFLQTQNSEIVYFTLKSQTHATHASINYIIPIGVYLGCHQWYCLDHRICQNVIIIKLNYKIYGLNRSIKIMLFLL